MPHSSRNMIDTLTGLRGMAALWVVLFHVTFGAPNGYLPGFSEKLDWGIFRNIIIQGVYAVDIFFVLSGYILTHVHRREFESSVTIRKIRHYLALRLARIYPLHLFVVGGLGSAYALGIWNQKPVTGEAFALSLVLMNMWSDPSINTPTWSVSAEWLAYLTFPVMIPVLLWWKRYSSLMLLMIPLMFVYPWCVGVFDWGWDWHVGWVALFRVLNGFFLGGALYYLKEQWLGEREYPMASGWCLILVFLFLFGLTRVWSIMFLYPLIPLMILALTYSRDGIGALFSHNIMVWLGLVSYAMYMVHYPVLEIFRWSLNDYYAGLDPARDQLLLYAHLGLMVAIVIGAAALCYAWIEKPCRGFVKRRVRASQPEVVEVLEVVR